MENINSKFEQVMIPVKGLIFFESLTGESDLYIEAYDTDDRGRLINAHPLSAKECQSLSERLQVSKDLQWTFLQPKGLLPENVLHIDSGSNGSAIWYTKAQSVPLFFVSALGIQNGAAHVPPLVWHATKKSLSVYALKKSERPSLETALHYAPFFNVYKDGRVCMGTVDIDIPKSCALEEFMELWQSYFFNSKFSHLLESYNPVNCNIVQLWKGQVAKQQEFPLDILQPTGKKLKHLLK